MWSAANHLFVLLWVGFLPGITARCAWAHEDCSHTGCCMIKGHTCYKKNNWWAGCMRRCRKGIQHHERHGPHADPWSCEVIDAKHKDCAARHEDCGHLGCCKDAGYECYRKDPHWAGCRPKGSCKKGKVNPSDPPQHRTPWDCRRITIHEDQDSGTDYNPDAGREPQDEADVVEDEVAQQGGHNEDLSKNWKGGLQATHFWDCNGGGCDAVTLNPWNLREYKYAPHYAPTDPAKHGGALYGEKLWLTGAASDALTRLLGPDTDCCGVDGDGGGGCGQCMLAKTWQSDNPHWLAVIMKKNRCPPWSNGCDKVHMDVAVPGFDNLQYSTANVCGDSSRSNTYIQKHHSAICGSVAPKHCNCWQLPGDTPEQRHIRDGCLLFKSWGWHTGTPKLDYRPVPCPKNFINWVKNGRAFSPSGVLQLVETWNTSSSSSAATSANSAGIIPELVPPAPPRRLQLLSGVMAVGLLSSGVVLAFRRGHWHWAHNAQSNPGDLCLQESEGTEAAAAMLVHGQ